MENKKLKESPIFLISFIGFFTYVGSVMGLANMFNTMMNTAYDLLLNTVFNIMAITVLAGAISGLFSEFGVVDLLNKLLAPLMKPLYDMPGVAALGIVTTYLSDNPAVLLLNEDEQYTKHFKRYQIPALANLGTSFGMGLITTIFIIGLHDATHENFALPALIGNISAVFGSIISTRLILSKCKKAYGTSDPAPTPKKAKNEDEADKGGVVARLINAALNGGKSGVDLGLSIIPGVLIICTLVMMLTNGPTNGVYTGAAYEGTGLLTFVGDKLKFILVPLFGISSSNAVSVIITSLGAAGAAIGMLPNMLENAVIGANDIAVITAVCICWSGFLSTHIAMMDSLHERGLTGAAVTSHAIGGLCAGIIANIIVRILALFAIVI